MFRDVKGGLFFDIFRYCKVFFKRIGPSSLFNQSISCKKRKSNTSAWVFFMFFKLYKWYQIAQSISYESLLPNELLILKPEIVIREFSGQ